MDSFGGVRTGKWRNAMTPRFTVPALLLLAVLHISVDRPVAAGDKATDEATIRGLVAAFDKSHNNHDAKAFATLFAPDADVTNVRGMAVRGRKAIEDFMRPLFEDCYTMSFENYPVEMERLEHPVLRECHTNPTR